MTAEPTAAALIRDGWAAPCRPWPRHALAPAEWRAMAAALPQARTLDLLAMWADPALVYALFHDRGAGYLLVSVAVEAGFYPALSPARPAAAWFERMIRDLWGHHAEDGIDSRPWLDHAGWALHAPLSARPVPVSGPAEAPEFFPPDREGLHQLPLGPILGTIGEPAQLRATLRGQRVVRLEMRLGYLHKGTLALMRGKSPRAAARFAARLAGDATVAHSIAFAHAAEAASSVAAPPRAVWLRAVMAEVERMAVHLLDLGAVADAADLALPSGRLSWHREALLRAAGIAFGHRLMMDIVVPGGVAADLPPDGAQAIRQALADLQTDLPVMTGWFTGPGGLADRLAGCGVVGPDWAAAIAAGGCVGRASGRGGDLRRDPGYAPYDELTFETEVMTDGDAAGRAATRCAELRRSAVLAGVLLQGLPDGPLSVPLPPVGGEGLGWAEGARGDVWHWMRLESGQIAASFARDPCWLALPLLEAGAAGVAADELALYLASFGASISGIDL